MGDPEKDALERTLAGTFQCQMQLSQQRNIVITGHLYSDDKPKDVNARIDLYQDALDRQYVRVDLTNTLAKREATLGQLAICRDDLDRLRAMQPEKKDGEQQGRVRLTSQQKQILERGDENIRVHVKNIEIYDSLIAAARAKLGIET